MRWIVVGLVSTLAACSPAPRETAPAPRSVSAAAGKTDPAPSPVRVLADTGGDKATFPEAPQATDACADRSRVRADLTERDDGREISVQPGDEICVRLPSNRALNYAWGFNDTMAGTVELVGEPGYAPGAEVGAGTESWRLRAVKAGDTTLRFEYLQPSDEPIPPEKSVRFPITVR